MLELSRRTGVGTDKLRNLALSGKIIGQRGEGRTSSWSFPPETVDQIQELGLAHEKKPKKTTTPHSPKESPFGPEWITTIEAAGILGTKRDAVQKRIQSGALPMRQWISPNGLKVNYVAREAVEGFKGVMVGRPTSKPKNRSIDAPDITEAELVSGGTGRVAVKQKNYDLAAAAKATGLSYNTLYQRIIKGDIKGEKVQIGPQGYKWYVPHDEVMRVNADPNIKPRRTYPTRKPMISQNQVTEFVSRPDPANLLTQKLLDMADMVRANPMMVVSRLEVDLSFKG